MVQISRLVKSTERIRTTYLDEEIETEDVIGADARSDAKRIEHRTLFIFTRMWFQLKVADNLNRMGIHVKRLDHRTLSHIQ